MPKDIKPHSAGPEGRHVRLNCSVLASVSVENEILRDWPKRSVVVAILSGSHRVRRVSFGSLCFLGQAPPKNLGYGILVRSPKWLV